MESPPSPRTDRILLPVRCLDVFLHGSDPTIHRFRIPREYIGPEATVMRWHDGCGREIGAFPGPRNTEPAASIYNDEERIAGLWTSSSPDMGLKVLSIASSLTTMIDEGARLPFRKLTGSFFAVSKQVSRYARITCLFLLHGRLLRVLRPATKFAGCRCRASAMATISTGRELIGSAGCDVSAFTLYFSVCPCLGLLGSKFSKVCMAGIGPKR